MADRHVTLHLDPVRSAANLLVMIEALARDGDATYASFAEMSARIRRDYDYTDRSEPLSLAKLLGLLDEVGGRLSVSATARAIDAMRPASRADVLHFLLASAWQPTADDAVAVAWAYRAFCDDLWAGGVRRLAGADLGRLVADLLGRAADRFPGAARTALSAKSVRGMRKWLEPLEPPVLDGDEFRRRAICSAELTVLAVGQMAREAGVDRALDILLTPERRETICRLCLLEPAALDRRLDQAIGAFPALLAPGTRAGSYGRFVRLVAEPDVTALVG